MPIDQVGINFLYFPKKGLSLKTLVFGGKEVALINLALFYDGAAFLYLPVLPCDFFLGAYPFSSFIKKYAAAGNLNLRLSKQLPLAENEVDMVVGPMSRFSAN